MQYLLVPVIMLCAIIGTVGAIKIIQKLFPNANKITDKAEKWINEHKNL